MSLSRNSPTERTNPLRPSSDRSPSHTAAPGGRAMADCTNVSMSTDDGDEEDDDASTPVPVPVPSESRPTSTCLTKCSASAALCASRPYVRNGRSLAITRRRGGLSDVVRRDLRRSGRAASPSPSSSSSSSTSSSSLLLPALKSPFVLLGTPSLTTSLAEADRIAAAAPPAEATSADMSDARTSMRPCRAFAVGLFPVATDDIDGGRDEFPASAASPPDNASPPSPESREAQSDISAEEPLLPRRTTEDSSIALRTSMSIRRSTVGARPLTIRRRLSAS
mmetsp:Transcript_62239/g.184074  ORF Transcript_62239/g.184074 Transcript_62239/m.184074 type:complete len:279 (-) Transcript_62239:609-1445(-)